MILIRLENEEITLPSNKQTCYGTHFIRSNKTFIEGRLDKEKKMSNFIFHKAPNGLGTALLERMHDFLLLKSIVFAFVASFIFLLYKILLKPLSYGSSYKAKHSKLTIINCSCVYFLSVNIFVFLIEFHFIKILHPIT